MLSASPTDPGVRLVPHRALVEGRTRFGIRDVKPSRLNPQARRFSDMLIPARSPEHALLLAFPPTGRLPSTLSAADLWSVLFEASQVPTQPSDSSHLPRQLRLLDFPSRPVIPLVNTGGMRSPRFQRAPFVRDVASDPGRATVPRIAAPHILPSAVMTASAPAPSGFSWLNPTPHTITVYASS